MNLMKINRSFRFYSCLRVLPLILFFPSAILASESDNGQKGDGFCKTPTAIEKQIESAAFSEGNRDLNVINEHGTLRVLLEQKASGCLISHTELQLLEEFAYSNDLGLEWIHVENNWQLLPELLKGNGDIIAGQDQGLSASIQDQIIFTHTWANAALKIVERSDNSRISRLEDLSGRQVAAYKSSPAWNMLVELEETQAGLVLQEIPPTVTYREVMERVKIGQYDLAVVDSLFLDTYLPSNSELQANFSLTDEKSMAWAVSADSEELHKTLNQYLNQQHVTHDVASIYFEDLSLIKDRGILRVITNSDPSHYYLRNGKLYGFEYELLREFAKKHLLRLDVVIAHSQEEMYQLLQEGKGDIIAASLPSSLLDGNDMVQYTEPYNYASPVVVGRDSDDRIIDMRDLIGRRITLAQDSPYWDYMLKLKEQGIEFELVKADEGINVEGTLLMVALGMYDLSIAGSHQMKPAYIQEEGLKSQFILSEPLAHRWAVRTDDQQLHNALNEFIGTEYRSAKYNVLHAKYFEQAHKAGAERLTRFNALSPYDDVTQDYSEKYGFDWRLVTALMFQESQFNPEAYSYAGAEGLMQLIPETAEFMGVSDTNNPEISINAGIRYLSYLRDKFEDKVLLEDRIWFTLASYNAGYGRVKRARALAEEMGLDKDQWFDNVELAMMALAKPYIKDGEQVRYCRCGQTVVYVREIRTRYFNYIRLTETQQLASLTGANRENSSTRYN